MELPHSTLLSSPTARSSWGAWQSLASGGYLVEIGISGKFFLYSYVTRTKNTACRRPSQNTTAKHHGKLIWSAMVKKKKRTAGGEHPVFVSCAPTFGGHFLKRELPLNPAGAAQAEMNNNVFR